MQQSVTRYQQQPHPEAAPDLFRLGQVLAMSGYFKDARDEAQAVVKILAGQEIGIGPVAAMMGIHIVDGKPTFSANLMASLIKGSRRYNYRLRTPEERQSDECSIEFFENGESVGISTFTLKDAERAGLGGKAVWKQYPRNLLFARAMSNGFKWYTPDLSHGLPVYTPEELGAPVDGETGEILRPLASVMTIPGTGGEPDHEPKLPHPEAEDTGETYDGKTVWRVGGVICTAEPAARGGRYLRSTQVCPEHNTPFFLSPDGAATAWAHGKGKDQCRLHLDPEGATAAHELPMDDAGA
jgi:hypothetical protein